MCDYILKPIKVLCTLIGSHKAMFVWGAIHINTAIVYKFQDLMFCNYLCLYHICKKCYMVRH